MKPISAMTQAELAAFVQSHLRKNKIYVTLSGGAAVSIYTVNRYVSADIDLVEDTYADRNKVNNAMEEIGFREKNRYFTHPETQHIIEFPSGPLSVGGKAVKNITEIKYATGILRVISPTDCVKDRLAAYYFWKDQQSFNQALLVAQNNPVNISEIKNGRKQKDILKNLKNS
ncbi:MAG: hypothetical protein Fur0017_28480 [Anaerolineales bacterium]